MGSSLEVIKDAIGALPERDRIELAAWLNLNSMDAWDKKMHDDFSPGGSAHHLVEKVRDDIRQGRFMPMSGTNWPETPR